MLLKAAGLEPAEPQGQGGKNMLSTPLSLSAAGSPEPEGSLSPGRCRPALSRRAEAKLGQNPLHTLWECSTAVRPSTCGFRRVRAEEPRSPSFLFSSLDFTHTHTKLLNTGEHEQPTESPGLGKGKRRLEKALGSSPAWSPTHVLLLGERYFPAALLLAWAAWLSLSQWSVQRQESLLSSLLW